MDVKEKLVELPIEDALLILREEHRQRTDSYTTYLAHGGKGDPAEEVGLDALAMAISALEKTKWISVDDRMPTQEDAPTEYVFTAYKNQNCYDVEIALWDTVIAYPDLYDYWMALPLPQPPKGE